MVTQLLWARDVFFDLPVLLTSRLSVRLWADRAEELFFCFFLPNKSPGGQIAGKSRTRQKNW